MESMEEGGWDVTKVDPAPTERIQSRFRIRPNERTSRSTCSCGTYRDLLWLNIIEMAMQVERVETYYFSCIDNIFRFTQAGSEVSALLRSYALCSRLSTYSSHGNGSHARTNYVNQKTDQLHRFRRYMYQQMTLRTLHRLLPLLTLDATTVLSRKIAELGIYPAVDPLDSTSRILNSRNRGRRALQVRSEK